MRKTGSVDGTIVDGASAEREMESTNSTNVAVRRALWVTAGIVVGAWLIIILFWDDAPFALTFDDAWYYLTIGRNLAAGKGSTFDGINLTNGYHPLWQAISIVPFKLGLDDLAAARALLVFQLLVGWGLTLALLAATIGRVLHGWPPVSTKRDLPEGAEPAGALTLAITLGLVAGSPFVVKVFVNGLESGIAATCDAALLYLAIRNSGRWIDGTTTRWRVGVSLLLAVSFLARTDAVFMLAALGLWCLAETARSGRTAGATAPTIRLLRLAELFALPAIVIATYLFVNQRVFGTPFQISGLVKRADTSLANIALFGSFVAAGVAVGWLAFRTKARSGRPRFPAAGTFAKQTGWFAAFCVVLIGYYSILQMQQWLWYYAPVVLYLVALMVLGVADMAGVALRDAPAGASAERALLPVQAVMGLLLVGLLAYSGLQFFDPSLRSIQIANAQTGEWMRANLAPDARIASWDAGALGYFSHRSVINIDGVVNSFEYYEALRNGKGRSYWDCIGLQYVANHGGSVNGEDPDIRAFLHDIDPARADQAEVVHRQPFTYSGVTTSTGGVSGDGRRDLVVYVYRIPDGLRCNR